MASARLSGSIAAAVLTVILSAWTAPVFGMEVKVVDDQLILTGPVVSDDLPRIQDALAPEPGVTTVILRNSPGGEALTGYRVGELFRQRGLRTAVSGFCYSSCSRMFLGGRVRMFTRDAPADETDVGFHGHYDTSGRLMADLVARLGLKDWIISHSDGKADPDLVGRWTTIPVNRGMIHFFHPTRLQRHDVSTFMCQGANPPGTTVFDCEPIAKSAMDLGIVTTLELIDSNDLAAVRDSIPLSFSPSGFAEIDDVQSVPIRTDRGRQDYLHFLCAGFPRAFAISPDGQHWGWTVRRGNAAALALMHCAKYAHQPCALYAVDGDVIWNAH